MDGLSTPKRSVCASNQPFMMNSSEDNKNRTSNHVTKHESFQ